MSNIVQLTRDPFARTQLVRRRTTFATATCAWCGSSRQILFEYGTQDDNNHTAWHKGCFCNKSCHNAYHNQP